MEVLPETRKKIRILVTQPYKKTRQVIQFSPHTAPDSLVSFPPYTDTHHQHLRRLHDKPVQTNLKTDTHQQLCTGGRNIVYLLPSQCIHSPLEIMSHSLSSFPAQAVPVVTSVTCQSFLQVPFSRWVATEPPEVTDDAAADSVSLSEDVIDRLMQGVEETSTVDVLGDDWGGLEKKGPPRAPELKSTVKPWSRASTEASTHEDTNSEAQSSKTLVAHAGRKGDHTRLSRTSTEASVDEDASYEDSQEQVDVLRLQLLQIYEFVKDWTILFQIKMCGGLKSTADFRTAVASESDRLATLCSKWSKELDADAARETHVLSEDILGDINVAIGQAELLKKERFKQFCGLIDDCEQKRGEKETTIQDLQGFWEIIYFQVDDIQKKFSALDKLQSNNWQRETQAATIKCRPTKVVRPRPVMTSSKAASTSALRAHIMAARTKMTKLSVSISPIKVDRLSGLVD
ncbi:SAPAP family [Trinorchestia longiramus]|nr:SAPAP family [Trinorchestia longiramus]